jgi:hypothetical protein
MNQWVLIQEGDNAPEIITIEVAGLTVGGTAQDLADHVNNSWDIGQQTVELVQVSLKLHLCDELAPLLGGGVLLHKLNGVMHDTCNTANLVPHLMLELRETSGRLFYGVDGWEALPLEEKRPGMTISAAIILGIHLWINGIGILKRTSKMT